MARYASNDQRNLKVGISSFSEEKTSLEVVGRIGLNTDAAMQDLDVRGNVYISGSIGIGTSTPTDAVDVNNTTIVNVGVVTANEYYGSGLGLTGITSATNATNIYGGAAGQILYQAQPGVTSAFESGSTGQGLFSRGAGQPPQWLAAAPAGAIEGILLFDEGGAVGLGTTYGGLDFRGADISVAGGNAGGIATITVVQQTYVDQAGVSTSVVGGAASVTQVNVDVGISSFADFKITSSGVGATVGGSAGVVTYYGSGTELSGIVTSLIAGERISLSASTGQVTITGIADTAIIDADSLVVSGVSTLGIVTGLESIGVVTAYVTNIVGTSATFTGNVTIGGTLIYEDVENVDSLGFVTARSGIHVGYDYDGGTGIGITLLPTGNAVFAGIVTVPTAHITTLGVGTDNPLNDLQVGLANSSFTVVSTATTTMVGIGTTNPLYTLDVRGDTNVDGNLTINNNTVPSLALVIALGGL
tara:strand:+ start:2397 stop:3815 length:1419 start_codon:yes stop_codon:yes gene_type:complete